MPIPSTRILLLYFVTTLLSGNTVAGQDQQPTDQYRIMFYNTENLFDPFDDTLNTGDDEYLPAGDRHWTWNRYQVKLHNLYRVIVSAGGWEPPAIIGLCELENRRVLTDLVMNTPLNKHKYVVLHKESPDRRGIDVGLIYRKDVFQPVNVEFIPLVFADQEQSSTRDILFVKGLLGGDTLNVYINHWPSRSGGQNETDDRRMQAALLLKRHTDELLLINPEARIVITGDFNDGPEDKSIREGLSARGISEADSAARLVDLSSQFAGKADRGTHKFQGEWAVLDQFIVSESLLNASKGISCAAGDVHIHEASFLLERDDQFLGVKPKRTFNGFIYTGGYSDHLPVYLDLKLLRE